MLHDLSPVVMCMSMRIEVWCPFDILSRNHCIRLCVSVLWWCCSCCSAGKPSFSWSCFRRTSGTEQFIHRSAALVCLSEGHLLQYSRHPAFFQHEHRKQSHGLNFTRSLLSARSRGVTLIQSILRVTRESMGFLQIVFKICSNFKRNSISKEVVFQCYTTRL